ncbi:hypothetical protein DFH28DRAFT_594801 [Melampsora americana]|nr:hypothetical protein DFH28DRAFT_594801 [Melampsora americana]
MFNQLNSWTSHRSILKVHKLRICCHIALLALAVFLLASTSVVLAYSIKMYYGGFLHAIPELLTASVVMMIVLGMAWLPSDEYVGLYGFSFMRNVVQEIVWTGALSLMTFGGVASLHQSTPGLMTSCGKFFICRGYISIFVSAWLCWLAITIPFGLLLTSAIYQSLRRKDHNKSVWTSPAARFEYFWPGEAGKKSLGWTGRHSRVEPASVPVGNLDPFYNEKLSPPAPQA